MKGKYIAIGVLILLISFNVTGSFISSEIKNISNISYDGNILYVGGSGPNNYTKIQDAINDSFDSDTVFVYNGTYYEHNITIDKSINLIGEDRDTTTIFGINTSEILIVDCNWVNISDFTLKNGIYGINLIYGNVHISHNNISSNFVGIMNSILNETLNGAIVIKNNIFWNNSGMSIVIIGNNATIVNVSENLFIDNSVGCLIGMVFNCIVSNNVFENNHDAVFLFFCSNCTFKNNYISNCSDGLTAMSFHNSNIFLNSFINNDKGLSIYGSGNRITKNNFIKNNISAIFERQFLLELYMKSSIFYYEYYEPIRILSKNTWDENYWNESRTTPYLIRGKLHLIFLPRIPFPLFNFDWHPASEPYDMEVLH